LEILWKMHPALRVRRDRLSGDDSGRAAREAEPELPVPVISPALQRPAHIAGQVRGHEDAFVRLVVPDVDAGPFGGPQERELVSTAVVPDEQQ
jgi:hypothetical protein